MSCAGKGYGTNPQSDSYLYTQFNSSFVTNSVTPKSTRNCRQLTAGFYPSFTPILSNLSVTTSAAGAYTVVNVYGGNFLPNGTTFIKFGTNYLPVTYFGSFNISFAIPTNLIPGTYNVYVVNLYNGNFSPPVNQSYSGNLVFSSPIQYTIT